MARQVKPKVRPAVCAGYDGPNRRTIEISHQNGGLLVSIVATDDGRLRVDLYRMDSTVDVLVPESNLFQRSVSHGD